MWYQNRPFCEFILRSLSSPASQVLNGDWKKVSQSDEDCVVKVSQLFSQPNSNQVSQIFRRMEDEELVS